MQLHNIRTFVYNNNTCLHKNYRHGILAYLQEVANKTMPNGLNTSLRSYLDKITMDYNLNKVFKKIKLHHKNKEYRKFYFNNF